MTDQVIQEFHQSSRDADTDQPDKLTSDTDLSGIWAPCLTPVCDDYSIDGERLVQHVNWLLSNGCSGIVLFGTTGEAASFAANERMEALETLISSGISSTKVMLGNGFTSINDTVQVTKHAIELGCRAVLMIPPYYFKNPSTVGLVSYYRRVLDEVKHSDLRVLLYHFPKMSNVPVTFELIDALIESHGSMIAGLKDSTGDWESTQGYISRYPDLSIFPGTDTLLLKGLQAGGAGTITATADINPHGIRCVMDLWQRGKSADSMQEKANTIRTIVSKYPLAPALKAVHAQLRGDPNWNRLRPPLMSLDKKSQTELMKSLADVGFKLV